MYPLCTLDSIVGCLVVQAVMPAALSPVTAGRTFSLHTEGDPGVPLRWLSLVSTSPNGRVGMCGLSLESNMVWSSCNTIGEDRVCRSVSFVGISSFVQASLRRHCLLQHSDTALPPKKV